MLERRKLCFARRDLSVDELFAMLALAQSRRVCYDSPNSPSKQRLTVSDTRCTGRTEVSSSALPNLHVAFAFPGEPERSAIGKLLNLKMLDLNIMAIRSQEISKYSIATSSVVNSALCFQSIDPISDEATAGTVLADGDNTLPRMLGPS